MKLEGSLDAFSLPDIFQLLSYTKKTGGLRLQRAGASGVVYFTEGAVTGAASDGGRQVLARRLVGLDLLDHNALESAVASAVAAGTTANGGGVVAALVESGAVDAATVLPVAEAQVRDAVFELLRWPSGDFALAVDEANPDDVGLRLQPDEVVTYAAEQQQRWNAAAELVPSPEAVPMILGSTEESTSISAADWSVLRLLDGRRRVSDIVDLLGAGQLASVVTLADLVERGLVQMRSDDAVDAVDVTARTLALLAAAETGVTESARTAAPPAVAQPAAEQLRAAPEVSIAGAVAAPPEVTAAVVEALSSTSAPHTVSDPATVHPAATAPEPVAPVAPVAPAPAPEARPAAAAAVVSEHVVSAPVVSAPEVPRTQSPVVQPAAQLEDAPAPRPAGPSATAPRLGGAHQPGDVVPPRAEPFIAPRQPEFAETPGPRLRSAPSSAQSSAPRTNAGSVGGAAGGSGGAASAATAQKLDSMIERDPSVNRSLLLRLIAGVRGL